MRTPLSRRNFIFTSGAASLASIAPRWMRAETSPSEKQHVAVRADREIGVVRPEFHGQFAEHLGSCIYGGLWVGNNSAIPNIRGYRKQAVEYLNELGVPVLRWPGGCFADAYHWQDGIGPASKRPKRVNINWGGYVEDNSFGTHEYIGLCRLIGAEPYIAGNVGSGSPVELQRWVEYCNFPSGSTLSDERAANGSSEPFRVRYWGVGNESWGCGGDMRPEQYADDYRQFANYIKAYGGTTPFLIASGPSGNDVHWTRGLLDHTADDLPNGISMHDYSGGAAEPTYFNVSQMNEQLSNFSHMEAAIVQQRAILDGYRHGKQVGLVLDEWGVWDKIVPEEAKRNGALWQQSTMRSAVAAGLGLNVFNRQADKLYMCNIAQIMNVLQSLLLTDGPQGTQCIRTTTYYAFALFKAHRSQMSVDVDTGDSSPLALSISASKAANQLAVSFVNPHAEGEMEIECDLFGANARSVSAQILHDTDQNACNSFEDPNRIVPKTHPARIENGKLMLDLPALSVATASVQIA